MIETIKLYLKHPARLWCRIAHYRRGWIIYPIFGALSPYVATCRKCGRCYYEPERRA